jgi:class 3 adenylate cyclase
MEGLAGVERDIAAVGDAVNTTARLASAAGPGEVLVSREAAVAAGIEVAGLEARQLTLKGKSQAQGVYVLPVAPE